MDDIDLINELVEWEYYETEVTVSKPISPGHIPRLDFRFKTNLIKKPVFLIFFNNTFDSTNEKIMKMFYKMIERTNTHPFPFEIAKKIFHKQFRFENDHFSIPLIKYYFNGPFYVINYAFNDVWYDIYNRDYIMKFDGFEKYKIKIGYYGAKFILSKIPIILKLNYQNEQAFEIRPLSFDGKTRFKMFICVRNVAIKYIIMKMILKYHVVSLPVIHNIVLRCSSQNGEYYFSESNNNMVYCGHFDDELKKSIYVVLSFSNDVNDFLKGKFDFTPRNGLIMDNFFEYNMEINADFYYECESRLLDNNYIDKFMLRRTYVIYQYY